MGVSILIMCSVSIGMPNATIWGVTAVGRSYTPNLLFWPKRPQYITCVFESK